MTLTSQDARLLLILTGHSRESAIRPSDYTANDTLALVDRLRAAANEETR